MSNSPVLERSTAVATPTSAPAWGFIRLQNLAISSRRRMAAWSGHGLPRALARLRSTGNSGLAGLGLLVFAVIFTWTVLVPERQSLASLREELVDAQSSARVGAAQRPVTPARQASDFVAQLPARSELPSLVAVVLVQADSAGLSLDSGSYEWHAGKDGVVGQYRMTLPVQGTYPQVRKFIEATLVAAPALALDSLRMSRDDVNDAVVEAEIAFTVFARGGA
jgi:hypothetical protein